jgi:serine/threonine protein kinase
MSVSTPTLLEAGRKAASDDAANALPAGHRLHEFELRGVIGVGGFGIVYRAFDHSLEREVAIKEYMPSALAGRSSKQQVSLLSASHSETFALGMSSFVNEAKLLARFDHPSLLKVHRFWEDNGTAYMVMPLYRGVTLRQLRLEAPSPDGAWLTRLLEQLLGALEVLHREGVYHRDIAPDNIIVNGDAPPVLLDFGAARRVISDRSQTLTAILKPSYAPLEQYAESSGMRQGPWTDFYALGATLHFMITGRPPVPATARALSDEQPRLAGSAQGGVPDLLLQVCDWMLAPRPHDRPQNAAEVRAALSGHLPVPLRDKPASADAWQTTVVQQQPAGTQAAPALGPSELPQPRARSERRNSMAPIWGAAAAMVLIAAAGTWWAVTRPAAPVASAAAPATASPAAIAAPSPSPAGQSDAANSADNGSASTRPPATSDDAPLARSSTANSAAPAHETASPVGARPRPVPARNSAAHVATNHPAALPGVNSAPVAATAPDAMPPSTPPAAPAAANGPAPVSVAMATHNPREQCAGRHLVAMHRCLVRECEKPEYTAHRECQKVRDIEARARNFNN